MRKMELVVIGSLLIAMLVFGVKIAEPEKIQAVDAGYEVYYEGALVDPVDEVSHYSVMCDDSSATSLVDSFKRLITGEWVVSYDTTFSVDEITWTEEFNEYSILGKEYDLISVEKNEDRDLVVYYSTDEFECRLVLNAYAGYCTGYANFYVEETADYSGDTIFFKINQ